MRVRTAANAAKHRKSKQLLMFLCFTSVFTLLITAPPALAYACGNSICDPNFSGYKFWPSGGNYAWEAYAKFVVPTISKPSDLGTCATTVCGLSIWVGLDGGTAGIAQGGVWAQIICNVTCHPATYQAWWEFLPAGPHYCEYVNPGDTIESYVYNGAWLGGNPHSYTIRVNDLTKNDYSCQSTQTMSMGQVYDADYLIERPNGYTLPYFTTNGNNGDIWFRNAFMVYSDGSYHSIVDPWNAGNWARYIMVNNGYQNTINGTPQADTSNGKFYILWLQSRGT